MVKIINVAIPIKYTKAYRLSSGTFANFSVSGYKSRYKDVLFVVYLLFQTFQSVDEILKCDHSNESY